MYLYVLVHFYSFGVYGTLQQARRKIKHSGGKVKSITVIIVVSGAPPRAPNVFSSNNETHPPMVRRPVHHIKRECPPPPLRPNSGEISHGG